jgi:hypothetical protein
MSRSIFIGFDPREVDGFAVTKHSVMKRLITPIPVVPLIRELLEREGLYTRRTSRRDGRLWDDISQAPMATEFAISRFLTPIIAKVMYPKGGLALFMDSDMLVRTNVEELFASIERIPHKDRKAVYCVKHNHKPNPDVLKMDGQLQTLYARKNWSSVMVFDLSHHGNSSLTVSVINGLPGRDLHRFCWLDDSEIGELDPRWNFLVGYSPPIAEPAIVHFTEGLPSMPGYEHCAFSDEWRAEREAWAQAR